ncbi:hypothetical protein RvY_06329 [Ramazzottius varieornatus]|uniref:Uncharacterized protein n=1 Tax=Ramazzottius varieornatus TaxID=947166 RepID=A0A1D1V4K6_RAMVA|nr:hypothetical protein RvY_06329 [Ramazzottius varieornatus]
MANNVVKKSVVRENWVALLMEALKGPWLTKPPRNNCNSAGKKLLKPPAKFTEADGDHKAPHDGGDEGGQDKVLKAGGRSTSRTTRPAEKTAELINQLTKCSAGCQQETRKKKMKMAKLSAQ